MTIIDKIRNNIINKSDRKTIREKLIEERLKNSKQSIRDKNRAKINKSKHKSNKTI